MRIAFDAKRAFLNHTGLGHYSRTLINSLAQYYPEHEYYLATPRTGELYQPTAANLHTLTPQYYHKLFPSVWRSRGVKQDLLRLGIELYHGLSHEIPMGIEHTGIRTVVTMHDLIFERYPNQYKKIDAAIYRKKFRNACANADKVVAISLQTKNDLVQYYHVPESKIHVCYQSCNPAFGIRVSDEERARVREQYGLPQQYLLHVGSVIERKNLLTICEGLHALKAKTDIPLVVIGSSSSDYMKRVKEYIATHGLGERVIFLSEQEHTRGLPGYRNSADFPAIYQMAAAMIYPSTFEGFGIPVLEALWSGTPVITSNVSCLPEAGGDGAYYTDPLDAEAMADAIEKVVHDEHLRETMITKGLAHAHKFTPQACAAKVMEVYRLLV